jgi:hydroxypyruvate reductase
MTKPEILQTGPTYAHTMTQLAETFTVHRYWEATDKEALLASIADRVTAVAATGGVRFTAEFMAKLPKVKLIANFGVGYDAIDVHAAAARGIVVTNTPDVLNECVADTAWMLVMATVRRLAFQDRYVREGRWLKAPAPLTARLWGMRLGILGLGRIGLSIVRRAEGFQMKIAYHNRNRRDDVPYTYYASPVELARNVDVLVIVTPGGAATQKIVSKEVIDALGPKGYLVNISRGSTVDELYLLDALEHGRIAGAGLDVFVDEPRVPEGFFKLDNVVLQPHVGSATHPTRQAMGQCLVDNLAAFFAGKPLLTPVAETPVK